jgi:hypothetical protein
MRPTNRLLLAAATLIVVQTSRAEESDGWISLFTGKDLDG